MLLVCLSDSIKSRRNLEDGYIVAWGGTADDKSKHLEASTSETSGLIARSLALG